MAQEAQAPPEYQGDMNPDAAGGINRGTVGRHRAGVGWPTTRKRPTDFLTASPTTS